MFEDVKLKLNSSEYDFLRTNPYLGNGIILLTIGGSHAYGTNVEGSDVDIRGCALNTKADILTNQNFEQVVDNATDTTIYAFNKLISLLSNCNPNVIELLGNRPEAYFYVSSIGQELLDNSKLFLSRKAIGAFMGYATAQFRRLDNKSARGLNQSEREAHIMGSIANAMNSFPERYTKYPDDSIRLYIDESEKEDLDDEIFIDINLKKYPLRDCKGMLSEMSEIIKEYGKIGHRNKNAITHGKLAKHMMHLIRLYLMCQDILEKEKIITYRENDLSLLMDIRNGKYLDEHDKPIPEFFELVEDLKNKVEYAAANCSLPSKPDYKRINEFVMSVNERVVRGNI